MTTDADVIDAIRKRKDAIAQTGYSGGLAQQDLQNRANELNLIDTSIMGFRSDNSLWGQVEGWDRWSYPTDPNFRLEDNTDLYADLPGQYHDQFAGVRSRSEGYALRSDILQETQDKELLAHAGLTGMAGYAISGFADIDTALMLLPGGSFLGGKVAAATRQVGLEGTRLANVMYGGAAGLEAGVLSTSLNAWTRPTAEWSDVPAAGLGGMVFGTGLGGITPTMSKANREIAAARRHFEDSIKDGSAGFKDYKAPVNNSDSVFDLSVGAMEAPDASFRIKSPDDPNFDGDSLATNVARMRDAAIEYLDDNDVDFQKSTAFPDNYWGRAAKKLHEFILKTPLAADTDRLLTSNSKIAQALGYKIGESPVGLARNNRSSAALTDMYAGQINYPVGTGYAPLFDAWAKDTGDTGSRWTRPFNSQLRNQFDQEVINELQWRKFDGQGDPNAHAAVKKMADQIDAASKTALEALQGKAGENPVRGSEELDATDGWFPQRWRGDKIAKVIASGVDAADRKRISRAIERTLVKNYRKLYPAITTDQATRYAKMVMTRAAANERGLDTNLAKMLDEEGADFLEDALVANHWSREEAGKFLDAIRGRGAEKNKQNFLKHRRDVDLRTKIEGTNYRLMDLVDTDIVNTWTGYSRRVAGASALARQGIQKSDKRDIINAILADQAASGGGALTKDYLEGVFSYFDGGAFAGGVNPWARRAMQATNLALLNGLGLTQLAETGVIVGAVGWEAFSTTAGKELKDILAGRKSDALQELAPYIAGIDGEEHVFMDQLMLDEFRRDKGMQAELGHWLDSMSVKARHIQGMVSGFYKTKQWGQRTAVRSVLYRLADHFLKEGKELGTRRLHDLGLDPATEHRVAKYFMSGSVERGADGDVLKLNFDKWDHMDRQDFALALNRHVHQVVQRAQRGESTVFMNTTEGKLLTHLKSFPLLAMQKQMLRNARIQDPEAAMSFMYSLVTAGTVYAISQASKGNTQNLEPEQIIRGAIAMNNMTAWLPMWSDPIASMLGRDDLRFSHYGATGVSTDIIGIPPVLPTLNRMAHIPEAAVGVATGNWRNEDIYALQSTPIIGNLYGFSFMFNEMKRHAPRHTQDE